MTYLRTRACLAVLLTAAGIAPLAAAAPQLIDNGGAGYSTSAWSEQSGVTDAFNSGQGFNSASNNTAAFADYTYSGLTPGMQYRVFATWRQAGQANVSTVVPYTLSDGGGVVNVNQQAVTGPANDLLRPDTNGSGTAFFRFQHLGTVTEGGNGVITARINGPATGGFSLSDAVILAEVPTGVTVIDNGGAGYTQTGFTSQASTTAFDSDQAFNTAANNGGFATWNFTGVADGIYDIFATWDQDGQANLSTAAPYTISDGGGLVTVNQELAPLMDIILDDTDNANLDFFSFQRLAQVAVRDGTLTVRLDAVAGGTANDFVFADAVAIRQVQALPEPTTSVLWLIVGTIGFSLVCLMRRHRTNC